MVLPSFNAFPLHKKLDRLQKGPILTSIQRIKSQCRFTCGGCTTALEFEFEVTQNDIPKKKLRVDSFLSERLPNISRERLKACILSGNVSVNSIIHKKPSYSCRVGDKILGTVSRPQGTTAEPEFIPLSVVYEDGHVLVVNKPAGMVVHPSPGHTSGTLVNAILHKYRLPAVKMDSNVGDDSQLSDSEELDENHRVEEVNCDNSRHSQDCCTEAQSLTSSQTVLRASSELQVQETSEGLVSSRPLPQDGNQGVLRPGIVHRLDKGTTGIMVVCRSDLAMLKLGQQFRERSITRLYHSITVGVPKKVDAEICTNIDRHPTDRLRMAVYGFGSIRGRKAISTYNHRDANASGYNPDIIDIINRVLRTLADGTAALVQWKLHTGRTHQIRVHAEHIGCPLLGDALYGGYHLATSKIGRGRAAREDAVRHILDCLERPALHAKTLGFSHPVSGHDLDFDSNLPDDLVAALASLESLPH